MPAVIFDLDGTLVDLFDVHLHAFQEIVERECGMRFEKSDLEPHYGKSGEEILKIYFEKQGLKDADWKDLAEKRRTLAIANLKSCALLSGAEKLLKAVKKSGMKTALGTSNPRQIGEAILNACGLSGFFDFKAYRDSGLAGKPAPDIFLHVAKEMGVDPKECVVIEDSVFGVSAAKAAGMKCIAVATGTHTIDELRGQKPDLLVATLEEVDLKSIKTLLT
ncbi:MAG: HAD family phosphatase [Candidatus Altiarchaeota archaeon]